jgi:hypothetical protein
VTISHIILTLKYYDGIGQTGDTTPLETFSVANNGKFTSNFVSKPSQAYNYTFNKIFEYRVIAKDNAW